MATDKKVFIFIMHSWTKIFSCTGLRIGSCTCPTEELYKKILNKQVPWSMNVLALKYIDAVILDEKYIKDTWEVTSRWRKSQI